MSEEFDFENIKDKAVEQLKAGKPLLGKDGVSAPFPKSVLNATLESGMDARFPDDGCMSGNRRDGYMRKQAP